MSFSDLYLADETAWLEQMSNLVKERRLGELDCEHLSEYLEDMAKRDRREVLHRLTNLLAHLLKWEHQPMMRTKSWEITVRNQREDLQEVLESQTLKNHAAEVLPKAYARAVRQAAAETGFEEIKFSADCPFTIDQLLSEG